MVFMRMVEAERMAEVETENTGAQMRVGLVHEDYSIVGYTHLA